jgi:hypothetical protein
VPLVADLPDWTPVEVPPIRPAKAAEAWVSRIGIPGAARLGMARRRAIGAIICALLVPVGAVRTVIGSGQSADAVDSWGPVDPILILIAVIGIVGVAVCVQDARRQRNNAVHSAQVLLKQANQQVTDFDLRPLLGSTKRFDEWAAERSLVPLTSSPDGEQASDEGARLMLAERDRGTHAMRVERFGERIANAFRTSTTVRLVGMVFVYGSLIGAAVAGVVTLILLKSGHPSASRDYAILVIALIIVLVIGWIVVAAARRQRQRITSLLYETLGTKDLNLTRSEANALVARPYLYDLWLRKHTGSL